MLLRDETVMSDADRYRQLAKKAMEDSSAATNDSDRRALTNVACLWTQAATAIEKAFGSSFASLPRHAKPGHRHFNRDRGRPTLVARTISQNRINHQG
jgi:hypothetical protein